MTDPESPNLPSGYGPFYRTGSKQDDATTLRQVDSSEIHGEADRGSFFPSIDAWRGELPGDKPGVEFYTDVPPDRGTPPGTARWSGDRQGLSRRGDKLVLVATITRSRLRQ